MKIVLDANVFISSFFWRGNPRMVFERVIEGMDELFVTKEILSEIRDVMERPKFHTDGDIIKGINTAGQALHQKQIRDLRPPAAAYAASRGVLNPSVPHSLDHARASTVAISLRSSINHFMYLIEATASQIVSKRKIDNGSRDKSDNKYIECELTAQFDYIISGDIHLFGANQINWLVETPYSKILSQSR